MNGSRETLLAFAAAFAGWLAWSLGHYAIHRLWHALMRLSGPWWILTHGELLHHLHYDSPGIGDPDGRFRGPPLWAASLAVALGSFGFGLALGWLYAPAFFGVALLSCAADLMAHDVLHRHGGTWAFQGRHDAHHQTHRHNFAFVTGVVWDVIFRTYRRKPE